MGLLAVVGIEGEPVAGDGPGGVGIGLVARAVDGEVAARHGQADAARHVQLPGQGEQSQDGANRLHAAVGVLQARVHDRAAAVAGGHQPGQLAHGVRRYPGDRGHLLGAEVLDVAGELIETVAPALGEGLVVAIFGEQHLDEPQGQGAVGAGADRDPLRAGALGGLGAARVDDHDAGAAGRRRFQALQIPRR